MTSRRGALASTTDSGVPILTVRNDSLSSNAGEYVPLTCDNTGALRTTATASSISGAAAEGAAATGNPVLVGGRYDATPRSLDDGDVGALSLNSAGHVQVERFPNDEATINATLSTTTPLAVDSTFSSGYVDVEGYTSLIVSVKSDHPGRLTIEHSQSGSGNPDYTEICAQRTTLIDPSPNRFTILHKYLRLQYTNTSENAQTILNITSTLGNHTSLNTRYNQVVDPTSDCQLTRIMDPMLDVCMNRRSDIQPHTIHAYIASLANSGGARVIWPPATSYTPPTTAETLDVVSNSTADASAGTGARTVTLYGINANRRYQTETVIMNGTTDVTTLSSWLGINTAKVSTAGSGFNNAGTIEITGTDSSTRYAQIDAFDSITHQAIFHAQANTRLMISDLQANMSFTSGTRPQITIRIFVYNPTSNVRQYLFQHNIDTTVEQTVHIVFRPYLCIGESGAVVFVDATSSQDAYTNCRFTFSLYEVKESFYTSTD